MACNLPSTSRPLTGTAGCPPSDTGTKQSHDGARTVSCSATREQMKSPADAGPSRKSMRATAKKGANSFINYVNPKLVNFTKPLMLAILIGGITLAGVVRLWT